jgi:1-acyl-sn-glycerol-3-phosphate acyltransferase
MTRYAFKGKNIVYGLENVPKTGPAVIVANHQSNIDPLFMIGASPRTLNIIAKKEIMKFPIFGKGADLIDTI